MRIKPGVSLKKLQPQMTIASQVVEREFSPCGYYTEITSGDDGTHKEGSLHGKGLALDFKTKHVSRDILPDLVSRIRTNLGAQFDVLLEDFNQSNEHLHIEFQPKA